MKFSRVFVFIIILFVLTLNDPSKEVINVEQPQKYEYFSFESVGDAMIYETIPADLNATFAAELAFDLFGLSSSVTTTTEKYVIEEGSEIFELYRACGSIWYIDSNKFWNVTYNPTLPDQATCESIANAFIDASDYLENPDDLLTTFGNTNVTAYNVDTREIISKLLNLEVNLGFSIDGIPLGGPGGSCSVSIGDGGEIIGCNWIKRNFVALQNEPIISLQDVLIAHDIEEYDSITHKLIYYQDAPGETQHYLCPFYEVEITKTEPLSNQIISFIRYLPATTFNPKVTITSPSDDMTFSPENIINFDCAIADGTEPFTYNWESTIDGYLNNSKSFYTNSLSEATKENTTISHTVTISVTDANGLTASDSVLVTITRDSGGIGFEYLLLISFLSLGLLIFLQKRNKRKSKIHTVVFLLTLNFTSSLVLNITSVKAEETVIDYSLSIQDFEDDSILEVGVEYCSYPGTSDYLPEAYGAAHRFYNRFASIPNWQQKFLFADDAAWEEDFKWVNGVGGGTDTNYIDAVDIALYYGHGNGNGFSFHSSCKFDDNWLHRTEAKWGDGDLEWILLYSCEVLAYKYEDWVGASPGTSQINNVFERWGHALQGVHMICGWRSKGPSVEGAADRCLLTLLEGKTVKNSWFKACKQYADDDFMTAVFYASPSDDPWNPQADDPINDRFPGFGFAYVDSGPAKWWVWISAHC